MCRFIILANLIAATILVVSAGCNAKRRPNVSDKVDTTRDERGRSSNEAAGNSALRGPHNGGIDGTGQASADTNRIERSKIGINDVEFEKRSESWNTERITELVDVKLGVIAEFVKRENRPSTQESTQDTKQLLAAGFACESLRPRSLDEVFRDNVLVVQRAKTKPLATRKEMKRTQTAEFHDQAGFGNAIEEFMAPIKDAQERRCKFKVTSVDIDGKNVRTQARCEVSGSFSDRHIQYSAIWNCDWEQTRNDLRLQFIELVDFEMVTGNHGETTLWADCTEAVLGGTQAFQLQLKYGLDHWLDRVQQQMGIGVAGYQGLAVGDVNGDGLDDLFVAQSGGIRAGLPNRLFVQRPDGTLEDVSFKAGLDWTNETHTALFVDLDNDGDQDIVVSTNMGLVFAENNGRGVFEAKEAKLTPEAPPMSMTAADFDLDGDLDIYACCYSRRASSQVLGRPLPFHDANNGGRNTLFRNEGNFRFTNATKQVGFEQNNRRFSFASAWEDYDNDGDLDLYVANDYGRNNLFRNDGGKFVDVAADLEVEDISAGMSVAWGDYNRDGWSDLYVSNMWSSAGHRIAYQRQFKTNADQKTRSQYQRHARGNSLFENRLSGGQPAFEDVSVQQGVTMGRWAWGSLFADINNDGWEDILVANGFVTQEDTSDL